MGTEDQTSQGVPDDDILAFLRELSTSLGEFSIEAEVSGRVGYGLNVYSHAIENFAAMSLLAHQEWIAPQTILLRPVMEDAVWLTEYASVDDGRRFEMAVRRIGDGFAELKSTVVLAERLELAGDNSKQQLELFNRVMQDYLDSLRRRGLRKAASINYVSLVRKHLPPSYELAYKLTHQAVHSNEAFVALNRTVDADGAMLIGRATRVTPAEAAGPGMRCGVLLLEAIHTLTDVPPSASLLAARTKMTAYEALAAEADGGVA